MICANMLKALLQSTFLHSRYKLISDINGETCVQEQRYGGNTTAQQICENTLLGYLSE